MNFDSLKEQVANLSLYDIKAGVRKVQNAVMNYTEMESKVREATNNEPWGASSTMMQDIANGTFNYQLLNEIMPMIYKRFTEKSAEEWRQIYKALQLLEFLIKNGSERVIDDVRSHLALIKMLRQFHYIDPNGKDQGINVRNRSKELTDLLSDVERIRAERKKARANKKKYGGVEGGAGLSGGMSSGSSSRYGGFGSESATYGGSTRQVYGDGGGFGGEGEDYDEGYGGASSSSRSRERYEEYDEYDEGAVAAPGRRKADVARSTSTKAAAKKPEPPKPKEPEIDLFDFGDDEPATISTPPVPATSNTSNGKAPANGDFGLLQSGGADDDDFDDFQSAAPATAPAAPLAQAAPKPNYSSLPPPISTNMNTQFAAPQPQQFNRDAFSSIISTTSPITSASSTPAPGMSSMMSPTMSPALGHQSRPSGYQATQPNYFQSVTVQPTQSQPTSAAASPGFKSPVGASASKPAAGGDAFASLLGGITKKTTPAPANKGLTMADMAKQKASAGIWGNTGTSTVSSPAASAPQGRKTGGAMDDLLG
ncbi:hypothetical protein AAFC00_007284 [Neodothiora populina]|uniref:ENTH domain-containing protein n=1 Tax=Neodothiora populina TaxID=2781224 RepID=A0ABR3PHV1_9PEZI